MQGGSGTETADASWFVATFFSSAPPGLTSLLANAIPRYYIGAAIGAHRDNSAARTTVAIPVVGDPEDKYRFNQLREPLANYHQLLSNIQKAPSILDTSNERAKVALSVRRRL